MPSLRSGAAHGKDSRSAGRRGRPGLERDAGHVARRDERRIHLRVRGSRDMHLRQVGAVDELGEVKARQVVEVHLGRKTDGTAAVACSEGPGGYKRKERRHGASERAVAKTASSRRESK